MKQPLLNCEISKDEDIVWVRNKARQITEFLKLSREDQTRVSTAVSEIARNAWQYARGGKVFFSLVDRPEPGLEVIVLDNGGGIAHLQEIESGQYKSPHGMGIGLMGARRLMDSCDIRTNGKGTVVTLHKHFGAGRPMLSAAELNELLKSLSLPQEEGSLQELRRQNEDILNALTELNRNREELIRLNRELEETNKGVVALYAELDEKAHSLKLASESKTAFLSNLTHEFRSPLNAIMGISRIIMKDAGVREDKERLRQVNFIMEAASSLSELVNDLLDIAKIEAGKVQVRVVPFTTGELLGTMRGLMRPIALQANLELQIEQQDDITMQTDESKVSQILRNLISNALKYTEKGCVRVTARAHEGGKVLFEVVDTGIGIEASMLEAIFDEFVQVDNPLQERTRGTGLGLPLSRRLARILGGDITVRSVPGQGSVFRAVVDRVYKGEGEEQPYTRETAPPPVRSRAGQSVLVIDDEEVDRYCIVQELKDLGFELRIAASVDEGLASARQSRPSLIILDLVMPGKGGIDFLNERLDIPGLRDIPIILHTSKVLEVEEMAFLEQSVQRIVYKTKDVSVLRASVEEVLALS